MGMVAILFNGAKPFEQIVREKDISKLHNVYSQEARAGNPQEIKLWL